jgi:hypothetical protein
MPITIQVILILILFNDLTSDRQLLKYVHINVWMQSIRHDTSSIKSTLHDTDRSKVSSTLRELFYFFIFIVYSCIKKLKELMNNSITFLSQYDNKGKKRFPLCLRMNLHQSQQIYRKIKSG